MASAAPADAQARTARRIAAAVLPKLAELRFEIDCAGVGPDEGWSFAEESARIISEAITAEGLEPADDLIAEILEIATAELEIAEPMLPPRSATAICRSRTPSIGARTDRPRPTRRSSARRAWQRTFHPTTPAARGSPSGPAGPRLPAPSRSVTAPRYVAADPAARSSGDPASRAAGDA